jgi:hypothetical protein
LTRGSDLPERSQDGSERRCDSFRLSSFIERLDSTAYTWIDAARPHKSLRAEVLTREPVEIREPLQAPGARRRRASTP